MGAFAEIPHTKAKNIIHTGGAIMKNKLSDKIEKYCKYCEKASALSNEDTMLCDKHGVVDAGHSCRHFRYDPLKRSPKKPERKVELEYVEV